MLTHKQVCNLIHRNTKDLEVHDDGADDEGTLYLKVFLLLSEGAWEAELYIFHGFWQLLTPGQEQMADGTELTPEACKSIETAMFDFFIYED